MIHAVELSECIFQFTPLREGLLNNPDGSVRINHFNSRPCERGFYFTGKIIASGLYFNSRPCERGFSTASPLLSNPDISIHAPARGASIHTGGILNEIKFQFTPLREGLHNLQVRRLRHH